MATIERRNVYLHHFIIGDPPPGMVVDHINGDRLDNRRANLRFCTLAQNKQNSRPYRGGTSRYKGVSWKRTGKGTGKWLARIRVDGKDIHLGFHKEEEEAAKAYDTAAIRYYGEFARTNF
jgi:hypothetical protein